MCVCVCVVCVCVYVCVLCVVFCIDYVCKKRFYINTEIDDNFRIKVFESVYLSIYPYYTSYEKFLDLLFIYIVKTFYQFKIFIFFFYILIFIKLWISETLSICLNICISIYPSIYDMSLFSYIYFLVTNSNQSFYVFRNKRVISLNEWYFVF